jgi:hypothetical protein
MRGVGFLYRTQERVDATREGWVGERLPHHELRRAELVLTVSVTVCAQVLSMMASAASYQAPAITAIAGGASGEVYIRFDGLPNPGPCGPNNGWVMVPSSNDVMKSLALSLYFNPKPVRVDTSSCTGAYETVNGLYSPGG